jgi:predicted phosphodiesterase
MRYLLLSDIHANAVALEAVLAHAQNKDWQQVIFLGDAVGYYPQAEEVVARLSALPLAAALLGNHDAVLLRGDSQATSRAVVSDVLEKQRRTLSGEAKAFLTGLTPDARSSCWEAVHATLAGNWDYVDSLERAQLERERLNRDVLFFGHTHIAILYLFTEHGNQILSRSVPLTRAHTTYRLPPRAQVLINPGSVGQPRDGVPLAAYAIFDEGALVLEHYRIPFDIRVVQKQIERAGYPHELGTRLERGR